MTITRSPTLPRGPAHRGPRPLLIGASALTSGAALVILSAGTAWAVAPAQAGWWTQANPGAVEGSPSPPAPPDVPAGGLLVEGGMNSTSGSADAAPSAFGAVVYPVPSGQTPTSLTLTVAPGSGTTPAAALELCPLSSPAIKAEDGGPISDAPRFDCTTNVTAQPSSSGGTYSFDVSKLVDHGALALAVLPTMPTDRVVLAKPGAASLSVGSAAPTTPGPPAATTGSDGGSASAQAGAPAGGEGSTVGPTASADPSSLSATLPDPAASLTPAPAGSLPAASAPQVPQAAASTSSATPEGSTGSAGLAPVPAPSNDTGGARPAAVAALVVGFLVGAAIWLGVGRAAARAAARGAL